MFRILFVFFLFFLMMDCAPANAQSGNDTIRLGVMVYENDTIPVVFLPDVEVIDRLPKKWVKKMEGYNKLKYNVYKVYPYAVIAASVLKDYDEKMAQLPTKEDRKNYKHRVELELKKKFKGELSDLSISQGQVLVKLINRQTGRDCFTILKEVKGGFNAVIYQSVALLFKNNLRREYDPQGYDRDMEVIMQELEATNYYRYQLFKQQQLSSRANGK